MRYADAMRRCLDECDVETVRRLWLHEAPHLPQPKDDNEAIVILHYARTQARSISFKKRAYSHRWLLDRGWPSGLPDRLKPKAERMYPVVMDAIGIACGSASEAMRPAIPIIRGVMEDVVQDHYADGVKDPKIIKPRMLDARKHAIKKLFG